MAKNLIEHAVVAQMIMDAIKDKGELKYKPKGEEIKEGGK